MPRVILVRHGQASAGTDNYDRLSPKGVRQATLLGEFWARQNVNVDAAFNGTLERQQHTAKLALQPLTCSPDVTVLPAIDEYDHTKVDLVHGEGITSDGGAIEFDDYLNIMRHWKNTPDADKHSLESFQHFEQRGWQAIREAALKAEPRATLVFFTSGGIVSTVLQQVLSLSFEQTMHLIWETRNASITQLHVSENASYMLDYNTVPHLLAENDKTLITQI